MDLSDITIVFTYYCKGDIRRKYLQLCLESVFGENNPHNIPILVVDGSPPEDAEQNRRLFDGLNNVEYIIDGNQNPFIRCQKFFKEIKTPYILRLLEDCIYLNFKAVTATRLVQDMQLLEEMPEVDVIQYPIINEQKFRIEGDRLYFPPIDFYSKPFSEKNGKKYYDRAIERDIYSYLCNSLIYRTDFFIKHWDYVSSLYSTHNHAEGRGWFDHKPWTIFNYNRYTRKIGHIIEHVIFRKHILKKLLVSESISDIHVIHIGYYSTEIDVLPSAGSVRKEVNGVDGVCSTVDFLDKFGNTEQLDRFTFVPDKRM